VSGAPPAAGPRGRDDRELRDALRLVTHDLRGLVAGIRAMARQLRGEERLWTSAEGPGFVAEIERAAEDALETIDLLRRPAAVPDDAAGLPRRISLARIAEAAWRIDPVFRDTPQFLCEPLSSELGCALTLKVEIANPIRSFKGRGADFFVMRRADEGSLSPLVCASAGNFGQALAYVCRKRSIPLVVYAARNANALKLERMRALGADVRPEGDDFDDAMEIARRFAEGSGASLVVDGADPEITEGAGSIGVELLARGDAFDAVLVPLGDGALLNGIGRWVKAAAPATRVVGVCAAGAPAVAESWRLGPGAPIVTHPSVDTIADGIAVRIPIPEALADMHGVVDDVLLVSDEDILRAMRLIHRHAGLALEPAGAAAVAALAADPSRFAGASVAAVLSGGTVTPEQAAAWFA
jgi:threonine dehydratase